jgi:hypothetical protein
VVVGSNPAEIPEPVAFVVYHLLYLAPGRKPVPAGAVNPIDPVVVLKDEP